MSQDEVSAEGSPATEPVETGAYSVGGLRQYVDDVRLEMKRVSWPTWRQVRSTTLVVLFFTFAMTGFVMVIDSICALLYRLVMEK